MAYWFDAQGQKMKIFVRNAYVLPGNHGTFFHLCMYTSAGTNKCLITIFRTTMNPFQQSLSNHQIFSSTYCTLQRYSKSMCSSL